jgi:hypothetical protein
MAAFPDAVLLTRERVLRTMPLIRSLFAGLGHDLRPYSAEAIATALVAACPTVTETWPSPEQIEAVMWLLSQWPVA